MSDFDHDDTIERMCHEAVEMAARIAALEAEVERLRSANNAAARFMEDEPARLAERLREMEREVERLLEALERMVEGCRCSPEERMSGHLVDCHAPDALAAIAAARARNGEGER